MADCTAARRSLTLLLLRLLWVIVIERDTTTR
jgi:hypothetical protein